MWIFQLDVVNNFISFKMLRGFGKKPIYTTSFGSKVKAFFSARNINRKGKEEGGAHLAAKEVAGQPVLHSRVQRGQTDARDPQVSGGAGQSGHRTVGSRSRGQEVATSS